MYSAAEKKSYWNGYNKAKAEDRATPKPRGITKAKRPHLTIEDDIETLDNILKSAKSGYNHLGIAGVLGVMKPFSMMSAGPSLHYPRNWTEREIEFLKNNKGWNMEYHASPDVNSAESDNYVNSVLLTGGKW